MTHVDRYPPGVPCWVDTLVPDMERGRNFYSHVFDWRFSGPGPMAGGGEYCVASVDGESVAGVGTLTDPNVPPAWVTYVCVASIDETLERVRRAGGSVIEAFDASPAGRGAVFFDSGGAVLGLWEPIDRQGAQRCNAVDAWTMSALQARDVSASAAFYSEVFGWKADTFSVGEMQMTLMRLPGYTGGVPGQPAPRDTVAPIVASTQERDVWSVGFWVRSADETAQRVREHDGEIVAGPFDFGSSRRAVVRDLFGAVFTVTSAPVP